MPNLVPNCVFYRIFDRLDTISTGEYGFYRSQEPSKKDIIKRNHQSIVNLLGASQLLILNQVHGNHVVDADTLDDFSQEPMADAAVTTRHQLILGIQTADCVPVLLSDEEGIAIGAAHCGWRSTKADILKNLVMMLKAKGAQSLKALIGPSIQWESYEVDHAFYDAMMNDDTNYHRLFKPSSRIHDYLFNLPGLVRMKLEAIGVTHIQHIQEDTYSNPKRYPSFRRDTHEGLGKKHNNILSTIFIR